MVLLLPAPLLAASKVVGYRIAANDQGTRFVLDVDSSFSHKTFTLGNPNRLVIDISEGKWELSKSRVLRGKDTVVGKVRVGKPEGHTMRVVLDLLQPVTIKKRFIIAPDNTYPYYRLVVDLQPMTGTPPAKSTVFSDNAPPTEPPVPYQSKQPIPTPPSPVAHPKEPEAEEETQPEESSEEETTPLPPSPAKQEKPTAPQKAEVKPIPAPAKPLPSSKETTQAPTPKPVAKENPAAKAEEDVMYGDWQQPGALASIPVPHFSPAQQNTPPASEAAPMPTQKPMHTPMKIDKPIIIIDPGHGGTDPGTIGLSGTREKNITFAFSVTLKELLEKTGRYRVVMTRNSDYFIPLRERVSIAKQQHGDLFISLHADSHPDPKTRGLSVYTLSEQASDREAQALAQSPNREQLINGVDLSANDDADVVNTLIDLVQRDTKNASSGFAQTVATELSKDNTKLLPHTHRFAGFRVLTGADIPSVLIELGYLSNAEEEKLLNSQEYKMKLVNAIKRAVDKYFDKDKVRAQ